MSAPIEDSLLVAACRGRQPADRVPVWFMRQAGRSLPEYREIREGIAMLDSCLRPDLVAEITAQPVRRYGVDAAILYSDIMVPLKAAGIDLDIISGRGPVIAHPIRSAADVEAIQPLDPAALSAITEAVGLVVAELGSTTPLIGFAGAPFTLASYLIEGGPSKDYAATKSLMVSEPEVWDRLAAKLADMSATFLQIQVDAGASVVQLFDSWAGSLSAADYARYAAPHAARILGQFAGDVPRIHFGVGTSELLSLMGRAGADVVGVDWRVPLDEASARIGPAYAVQGNLDPALLKAPWPVIRDRVEQILRQGAEAPGHIFNLGHGVPPDTDPEVLAAVVDFVHSDAGRIRREVSAR